ncbi:MAG: (2Fe-2S) ferredoxin domain-containing protein [Planctomycetota bacterium]
MVKTNVIDYKNPSDPEVLALAFVVRTEGGREPGALARFQAHLERKGLFGNAEAFEALLTRARKNFETGGLFVCQGPSCCKRQRFGLDPSVLGPQVTVTSCQGHCGAGPVATLKRDGDCSMFAQFEEDEDWRRVVGHATGAVKAEAVAPYRFDPRERERRPSRTLDTLSFLIGRFRGTSGVNPVVEREIEGAWASSGRFIRLEIASTHHSDGRVNTYRSCIMVGAHPGGHLEAHTFLSTGEVELDRLHWERGRWVFGARTAANGLRKYRRVLQPVEGGFEDIMESDDEGLGIFVETAKTRMLRSPS